MEVILNSENLVYSKLVGFGGVVFFFIVIFVIFFVTDKRSILFVVSLLLVSIDKPILLEVLDGQQKYLKVLSFDIIGLFFVSSDMMPHLGA